MSDESNQKGNVQIDGSVVGLVVGAIVCMVGAICEAISPESKAGTATIIGGIVMFLSVIWG